MNSVEYGIKTRPYWIDVSIVSADGRIVKSFPADQKNAPPALVDYLLTETQKRSSWLLVTDRTRDESRPIVAIATPIKSGGAVILRVDGAAINALFSQIQSAGSAVIAVFDAQGQLLFRKQTSDTPLTIDIGSSPLLNALGAQRVTVAELQSPYTIFAVCMVYAELDQPTSLLPWEFQAPRCTSQCASSLCVMHFSASWRLFVQSSPRY